MLDISKWTKDDLSELLNVSGYSSDDIITTRYVTTVNHVCKFEISFPDEYEKGGIGYGFVFVSIDHTGCLSAGY